MKLYKKLILLIVIFNNYSLLPSVDALAQALDSLSKDINVIVMDDKIEVNLGSDSQKIYDDFIDKVKNNSISASDFNSAVRVLTQQNSELAQAFLKTRIAAMIVAWGNLLDIFRNRSTTQLADFKQAVVQLYGAVGKSQKGILNPTDDQRNKAKTILKDVQKKDLAKLKQENKNILQQGMDLLLVVDPLLIPVVIAITAKAGMDNQEYNLIVQTYQHIVDQLDFLIGTFKKDQVIGKNSSDCRDLNRALEYPKVVARFVSRARGLMASDAMAKIFVTTVKRLEDRLLEIINNRKETLKNCVQVEEYIAEIVALANEPVKSKAYRSWCKDEVVKLGGSVIAKPEDKLPVSGPYYKHFYLDLDELLNEFKASWSLMFDNKVRALEHAYEVLDEFRTAYETQKECRPALDDDITFICKNRSNFYALADLVRELAKIVMNSSSGEISEETKKHAVTLINNLIWFYRLCDCLHDCGTMQMMYSAMNDEWIRRMREGMPKQNIDLPPGVMLPAGFEDFFN